MIDQKLIEEIKKHEGLRLTPYKDSYGFLTIGYGTKLPLSGDELTNIKTQQNITQQEAQQLLLSRLEKAINSINAIKSVVKTLSPNRKRVIYNMCYQLGTNGVINFKKMWSAIENGKYKEASLEMLDSKWAKQDSPKRAQELAHNMCLG